MRTRAQSKNESKTSRNLWRNSPCSVNYVLQNPSMNLTQRFNIDSIYYRDQVDKPKKIFTAFQKPDLLLQQFRKQIEEASHQKYRTASKNKLSREKQKSRAKSLTTTVDSKFYEVPEKNEYKYDRNGIRSNLAGDYDAKDIEKKIMSAKVNFGSSRRVDLSRPLNFFPGPGTYHYDMHKIRIENTSLPLRTCTQFRKKQSLGIENPQTERRKISQIQKNFTEIVSSEIK